jgi:hypothetical protein
MNKKFKNGSEPYSKAWNYEIALYRDDQIVDTGTIKEIAERRGCQKATIRYYLTPAGHRRAARRKRNGVIAVRIDD